MTPKITKLRESDSASISIRWNEHNDKDAAVVESLLEILKSEFEAEEVSQDAEAGVCNVILSVYADTLEDAKRAAIAAL